MRAQDRLLTHTFTAVLPLVLWGVHFFFCYAYAAVACQRGSDPAWVLGAVSVLAVGAAALLFARSLRRVCRQGDAAPALHDWATLVTAALSLVAIVWTCVPMLMVEMCSGSASF